jgi:hypothetical protein
MVSARCGAASQPGRFSSPLALSQHARVSGSGSALPDHRTIVVGRSFAEDSQIRAAEKHACRSCWARSTSICSTSSMANVWSTCCFAWSNCCICRWRKIARWRDSRSRRILKTQSRLTVIKRISRGRKTRVDSCSHLSWTCGVCTGMPNVTYPKATDCAKKVASTHRDDRNSAAVKRGNE